MRIPILLTTLALAVLVGCDGEEPVAPAPADTDTAPQEPVGERIGEDVSEAMRDTGEFLDRNADDVGGAIREGAARTEELIDDSRRTIAAGQERAGEALEEGGEALQHNADPDEPAEPVSPDAPMNK